MKGFAVVDVDQRSPEWFAARCGRLTSSAAAAMLARIKTGEAAARRDLRLRLAVERITGVPQEDGYVSSAMQHGIDAEAEALAEYEIQTGVIVSPLGFLQHRDLLAGYSPDGVIGDFDGLLELKCPKSATHLRYLRAPGVAPTDYVPQVTHALWLTGAPWLDFVSFDPRFPEPLRFFRVRVPRNEAAIAGYELMVRAFLAEVDAEVEAVRALLPVEAAV